MNLPTSRPTLWPGAAPVGAGDVGPVVITSGTVHGSTAAETFEEVLVDELALAVVGVAPPEVAVVGTARFPGVGAVALGAKDDQAGTPGRGLAGQSTARGLIADADGIRAEQPVMDVAQV